MSTLTKEWLLKTISELEEERNAVPGVINVDAAMALAAMKLALASLEAQDKIPELRQVIYHFRDWNEGFPIERFKADYVISWMLANYPPAQPAAVSVPDDVSGPLAHAYKELTPTFMRNHIDVFERYGIYPDGSAGIQAMRIALDGMNRRAAMLQGADGNSPVHSGCRPAQNCISPAQCGNSPAIPDGWVMVPVEPTIAILDEFDSIIDYGAEDSKDAWSRLLAAAWIKSLPAAPQQEVK